MTRSFFQNEADVMAGKMQIFSRKFKMEDEEGHKKPGYFPFPFPPYDIQEQFMNQLYSAIESGKVGLFESPTGTGKSLSLICGVLTWLRDQEEKKQEELKNLLQNQQSNEDIASREVTSDEPSWITEFEEKQAKKQLLEKLKFQKLQQEKSHAKLKKLRQDRYRAFVVKNKRKREESINDELHAIEKKENVANENEFGCEDNDDGDDDHELVLDDYHSDVEDRYHEKSCSESEDEEEENDENVTKIFYCSRTHSQLAQFVNEVKKSPFGQETRVVSLGSRQNYCINESVQRLRNISRINEKCLELQRIKYDKNPSKGKTKRRKLIDNGCKFYQKKKIMDFAENVFVDIQDIEQLVELGKELSACPYYGTRVAARKAQLIVLPYNTLLHQSTRDAVGINLKDSIVIVDEAHNLIDTINTLHSVEITGSQLLSSRDELSQYLLRYRSRLKAKNLMYVNQLLSIMETFIKFLEGHSKIVKHHESVPNGTKEDAKLYTIHDFVFAVKIDNLNLFKIRKYCKKSMIAKKLNGFVEKYSSTVGISEGENNPTRSSHFYHIEAFLEALTNANEDGRMLVSKYGLFARSAMKFLLLNPAVHFAEVVNEAKSVIIAGGTMQPISEFKDVLLYSAGVPAERITEFSCGHVIPPENLLAIALSKGPSTADLDFTFQNREQSNMIEELGRVMVNLCTVVPAGVVCFFPSYEYEEKVYMKWAEKGYIKRIELRKKIFREPRKSGRIDQVLSNFSEHIKRASTPLVATGKPLQNGALLLSVVGGKMSEGINFSDDLGRCIVMVGLPFPNKNSPELKEKITYLNRCIGPNAGQQHYENICMKAVNQSIGRAIRHRNDFACIVLLDQRYSRTHVQSKLPAWIQSRLQAHPRFGPAFAAISKFFADKRARTK